MRCSELPAYSISSSASNCIEIGTFTPSVLAPEDDNYHSKSGGCASQQILGANVRFGSKADIAASPTNVRFTPKGGHWNLVA
jgi:hypothetical protein